MCRAVSPWETGIEAEAEQAVSPPRDVTVMIDHDRLFKELLSTFFLGSLSTSNTRHSRRRPLDGGCFGTLLGFTRSTRCQCTPSWSFRMSHPVAPSRRCIA